jgi:hypothetical protein
MNRQPTISGALYSMMDTAVDEGKFDGFVVEVFELAATLVWMAMGDEALQHAYRCTQQIRDALDGEVDIFKKGDAAQS